MPVKDAAWVRLLGTIQLVECKELAKTLPLTISLDELCMLVKMIQVQSEICLKILTLSRSILEIQILLGEVY